MLSQVYSEGIHFQLLKEICDHRSDRRAIQKRLGFNLSQNGIKTPKITTVGWKLQVDESIQLLDLYSLKASYPPELGEYAVSNKIKEELAFNWWVEYALCNRG